MRKVRLVHQYVALFFAPMILLFAVSGALQTFGLHETHDPSAPPPPRWIAWLASIHKDQSVPRPERRHRPPAMMAGLAAATRPPTISHTGCRSLHDNPRNAWDESLKACADKGGVFGIYWMPFLVPNGKPTTADLIHHIGRNGTPSAIIPFQKESRAPRVALCPASPRANSPRYAL